MHHTSRRTAPLTRRLRPSVLALGLALACAACGSSDSTADGATSTTADAVSADQGTTGQSNGDAEQAEDLADELTSGLSDEEQAELDAGLASIDNDTRFDIIGDQMETPPVEILVDGNNIRIRFDAGTVEDRSLFDCTLLGLLAQQGETYVVEYPDGETDCWSGGQ